MAKTTLPTNYVDDVLNGAMDGKRRYREIPNADGTISLEDATTYDQIGSNFGASQLNLMSDNINQSFDANKMLKSMDEVNAVIQEGYGVDAIVVKQVKSSLTNENSETFNFGVLNGVRGYFTNPSRADDCFIPFKSNLELIAFGGAWDNNGKYTVTLDDPITDAYIFVSSNTEKATCSIGTEIKNANDGYNQLSLTLYKYNGIGVDSIEFGNYGHICYMIFR